jgi:hypothetical protein
VAVIAASTCGSRDTTNGSSVPSSAATITKTSACTSDSTAVAVSLANSSHGRGSGAASSMRITPISRS